MATQLTAYVSMELVATLQRMQVQERKRFIERNSDAIHTVNYFMYGVAVQNPVFVAITLSARTKRHQYIARLIEYALETRMQVARLCK